MLKGFVERENEIFRILDKLTREGVDFILIGGYAVSAYQRRFSVDADIVVKEEQLELIRTILKKNGFEHYKSRTLENVYNGKFEAFIMKSDLPITVDMLINAVSSRQTDASWSFEVFKKNSEEKEIKGIEKSITTKIPIKELLIATKIHACRLTDVRDVVAICNDTNVDKIIEFSKRGEFNKLRENIRRFDEIIHNKKFIDSFKGVFSLEKLSIKNIKDSEKIIEQLNIALSK